jgi:POT family proton-dependent oligopeptide transporter
MNPSFSDAPRHADFLGHPKGLYICFFTEMWERFSFYGMKALLLLYLVKYHLFSDDNGYNLLGAYGGLVYAMPVIGGLVADRWLGMRKAVVFGGILLVLGPPRHGLRGSPGGHGRWCHRARRGRTAGVLFLAGPDHHGRGLPQAQHLHHRRQAVLHGMAEPPSPERLRERVAGMPREWAIYLATLLGLLPIAGLMWATGNDAFTLSIGVDLTLAQLLMLAVLAVVLAWFTRFVLRDCTPRERGQMLTLMALIFIALLFYTLYEQTYGSWVVFTDRLLTKDFFPSLVLAEGLPFPYFVICTLLLPAAFMLAMRWQSRSPGSRLPTLVFLAAAAVTLLMVVGMVVLQPQTAGSLTFISGIFILSFAPLFSWLWSWLDRRGRNPGKPLKSVLGLLFGALSFLPLYLAAHGAGDAGTFASVWWLVLAYAVLQVGEICLYPVGLSAVTQLSVPRVASLMMGTWFLATAFSELLAAKLGTLASIEDPGAIAEHSSAWTSAATTYGDYFWSLALGGLACTVLAALALPWLNRGMHGVK